MDFGDVRDEFMQSVLELIDAAKLPHPSGALLESFVREAVNPAVAARYMHARLSAGEAEQLLSDWVYIVASIAQDGRNPPPPDATTRHEIIQRDGGRCCVTGKAGNFNDALVVAPILPVPHGWTANDKPRVFDMLGAFFGPQYRDWWLSYASDPRHMMCHYSHWLVLKSTAKALAQGRVRLDRRQPSMVEYEVNHVLMGPEKPIDIRGSLALMGDHSRAGIFKVDPRFVGSHARFCRSIRLLQLADKISPEISPPRRPLSSTNLSSRHVSLRPRPSAWRHIALPLFSLPKFFTRALGTVWLMLPSRVRVAAYEMLRSVGQFLYGPPGAFETVQRLPFGLYLKYLGEMPGSRNEFNALSVVRQYTSIPVPKPLDVAFQQISRDDLWDKFGSYLLITRVPGSQLSLCQELLSERDYADIADQMKDYLTQLRGIPNKVNPDMPICNTLGEAIRDTRIRSADPFGPFPDEASFSQILRYSDDPGRRGHRVFFTHADLNPRNILVDEVVRPDGTTGWKVTGIVDWENSGYYPEYWDYTKAMFEGFRWTRRYNDFVRGIFRELGDYSKELDVETRAWESGDAV